MDSEIKSLKDRLHGLSTYRIAELAGGAVTARTIGNALAGFPVTYRTVQALRVAAERRDNAAGAVNGGDNVASETGRRISKRPS